MHDKWRQLGRRPERRELLGTRELQCPMRVAQTPKILRDGICRNRSARIAHGYVKESRYVDSAGLGFDRYLVRARRRPVSRLRQS